MTTESASMSAQPVAQADVASSAHERIGRAIKALAENRLDDALRNARAIAGEAPVDRVWKALLYGGIGLARGDLRNAESELQRAASLALESGLGEGGANAEMFRLAARALNDLGRAHRRRERLAEAQRAHGAAYGLRVEFGSEDERWESAMDLGIDQHLARQFEFAAAWHSRSLEHASRATETGRKRAEALGRLSTSLLAAGRFEEAISAARSARGLWQETDAGGVKGFRAELHIGHALLMQAQAQLEIRPSDCGVLLDEALHSLTTAREELAAFGAETAEEVRSCEDQLDFARRLRASLD